MTYPQLILNVKVIIAKVTCNFGNFSAPKKLREVLKFSGLVNSERSMVDSDFAKTANYIMKTAMKLPPHILPTLDELDSKTTRQNLEQQIGV